MTVSLLRGIWSGFSHGEAPDINNEAITLVTKRKVVGRTQVGQPGCQAPGALESAPRTAHHEASLQAQKSA